MRHCRGVGDRAAQGITAADLIRMLDSGMRISDFLNATNVFAEGGHTIDRDFS